MVRRATGTVALVVCAALAGCGGPAEGAPTDASPEDFCAAISWFRTEGLDRFRGGEFPPAEDDLADLARDWAARLVEVGTPDNMSDDARAGFEKFVDRLDDMEGGDIATMGWNGDNPDGDAEKGFANYVTNAC